MEVRQGCFDAAEATILGRMDNRNRYLDCVVYIYSLH